MKKNLFFAVLAIVFTSQIFAQTVLSSNYGTTTTTSLTNSNEFTPYWSLAMEGIGIGFLEDSEKIFEIMTVGANRYISENTYIGARIGYTQVNIIDTEYIRYQGSYRTEAKYRYITIPVELGYLLLNTDSDFKIGVFAGVGINYCIKAKSSGSYTVNRETYDFEDDLGLKGKVGFDGKIGVKLAYSVFGVSASYVLPLNKKQDLFTGEDPYFKVGLCCSF